MGVGPRIEHVFTGEKGIFSNSNAALLPDSFMSDLRAGNLNVFRMVQKRKGRSNTGTGLTAGRNRRLFYYAPAGGVAKLVTVQAAELAVWTGSGTWSSVASGITEESTDLIQIKANLYIVQQTDGVRYYDGSTVTAITDANTYFPKTRFAAFMLDWPLAFNSAAEPSGLFFGTNGGDPTSTIWNRTSNLLRIENGRGGEGTGIKPWTQQDLVCAKEGLMVAVTLNNATPANWTITPITSDIGCVSGRTMVQFGEDFLFLSQDGVRSLVQSAQDKKRGAGLPLSWPINDLIKRINWQYAKDVACATEWDGEYWLSVPLDANQVNSITFIFNPRLNAWARLDYGFQDFAVGRFSAVPTLYSSQPDAATGGVNKENDTYNHRGAAISWQLVSKRINGPNGQEMPQVRKREGEVELEFESTGSYVVDVYVAVDGGASTLLGSMTLTGTLPQLPIALPFSLADQNVTRQKFGIPYSMGVYHDIQLDLRCADVDADIRFIRATVSMIPMEYVRDA